MKIDLKLFKKIYIDDNLTLKDTCKTLGISESKGKRIITTFNLQKNSDNPYVSAHMMDLRKIKNYYNLGKSIYFSPNGWVEIGGKAFNGFRREDLPFATREKEKPYAKE